MASRAKNYPRKASVWHVRIQPTTLGQLSGGRRLRAHRVKPGRAHELHRALADMGGTSSRTHVR